MDKKVVRWVQLVGLGVGVAVVVLLFIEYNNRNRAKAVSEALLGSPEEQKQKAEMIEQSLVAGDFAAIDHALQSYKTNAGNYPSAQQGLIAMVDAPTTDPLPRRWVQFFDRVPKDPWDNEYIYKYPGSKNSSRPELISLGKDGLEGTEDDMSSQDPR